MIDRDSSDPYGDIARIDLIDELQHKARTNGHWLIMSSAERRVLRNARAQLQAGREVTVSLANAVTGPDVSQKGCNWDPPAHNADITNLHFALLASAKRFQLGVAG